MLEKIGLPPKPSMKGNNWVVDATHCQGCSSQFTFIHRKHHCRRCGGIFCGTCTQQRMVLRGQGDSPVRICEPCKKLEEASRFESRYGHKNRAAKGGLKPTSKRDEQILGNDDKLLSTGSASCSNIQQIANPIEGGDNIVRNLSLDQSTNMLTELEDSATPEDLRQQSVVEKTKYKTLKAQGKSEEALKAFKRGKELERQAAALEISLRKNRKKDNNNLQIKDDLKPKIKEKDDLSAELKELGWSDADLHEAGKKPANLTLEGELSSLLREVSSKSNKEKPGVSTTGTSQVLAHKKRALELKRAGNLLEAKEELKRAKILERKIEEEELLGGDADDESDDELSSLIRSMDEDEDLPSSRYNNNNNNKKSDINFDLNRVFDDVGVEGNFEVTDEDLEDPEMASALKSLGWTEDISSSNRESLQTEIQSLKQEALNKKRAGNVNTVPKVAKKSKFTVQKELIALKKSALTLRREGKLDESEEELKKAKILEEQLEEMNKAPIVVTTTTHTGVGDGDGDEDEEVTDQDLHDPSYLSLLKNLGWEDEDNSNNVKENDKIPSITSKEKTHKSKESKTEIQRELLALKRKALTLRRQGETEEADEVLKNAALMEAQFREYEEPRQIEVTSEKDEVKTEKKSEEIVVVVEESSPSRETVSKQEIPSKEKTQTASRKKSKTEIQRELLALKRKALVLRRQGETDEADEVLKNAALLESQLQEYEEQNNDEVVKIEKIENSQIQESSPSREPISSPQQEILAHKRKALALKREGKLAEAKEELRLAKILENTNSSSSMTSASDVTPVEKNEKNEAGPSSVVKPLLSSRDRFKLQQESLGHKRKALKLRREGKNEEADVESELAKALENQLLESESQDSSSKETDSVSVEDFLDPQLLFALQSIGLENVEKPEPVKVNSEPVKVNSDDNTEREQLVERIKAEKVKAVNLKRSGKQVEALDALRRAKLYEKKLQSLS